MSPKLLPHGPPANAPPEGRRFLMSVVARQVLEDVARALGAHGIPVLPLKGVLFQQLLYADPVARALMDVDVLVPERQFERAIRVLVAAGFRARSAGRSLCECALTSPRGMSVDLHRRLFSRGRYKLTTEAVFRRSTQNLDLLGTPLQLAHPHDIAAHLVGKFVSDHEAHGPGPRLLELARWLRHCAIDPQRLARHLRACGMSRAARYTFARGVELDIDPCFRAALAALPGDALGQACCGVARASIPRLKGGALGALPAHLLNESLPRGAASLALSAAERLRYAWLARQRGKAGGIWALFFGEGSHRGQRRSLPPPSAGHAAEELHASRA
jgi:hypothetical protein